MPCSKFKGGEGWRREEDMERLEALLRAHKEAAAGQKAMLGALELMRMLASLLAEDEGGRWICQFQLAECLVMKCGARVKQLLQDLRRIVGEMEVLKEECKQLRALTAWMGKLKNLKSLEVSSWFEGWGESGNFSFERYHCRLGSLEH